MRQRHEAHVVVIERVCRGSVREAAAPVASARGAHAPRRRRRLRHSRPRCTPRLAGSAAPASMTPMVSSTAASRDDSQRRRLRVRTNSPSCSGSTASSSDFISPRLRCRRASALPIAAMKRCLMNTQSSGGLATGADSVDLRDDRPGPGFARAPVHDRGFDRQRSRTVCVALKPIALAAVSRSAPCAVAVS